MSHKAFVSTNTAHPLGRLGWDDGWEREFFAHNGSHEGWAPGRVIRVDRGQCDVHIADGTVRAVMSVSTRHPEHGICTGDWVIVDVHSDPASVRGYLPRRTAFVRGTSSGRSQGQVLAANVDHVGIVVSLALEPDLGRIERLLALAWESGGSPLIALTKADLVPDPAGLAYLVDDVANIAPGVHVLPISSLTGEGLDVLRAMISDGTSVLLGVSGAGKSTLANLLLGEDVMAVQTTRDADGKGRHTTTTRNLFLLPDGGVLIDTPGLRGVGLWDAEIGVGEVFSEIEDLASQCRFHDCGHTAEPGCAVAEALEDGRLPERRLDSYRKLLRENRHVLAKSDARLRSELRKEWKQRSAEGRMMYDAKRGRPPRSG
ncbi:MAG: ribosome small subunit-dependent GTPase A [Brevibacterium aurantiacum]|nr:ribosome small subunit-dependent GTPase A [Brevibacterium aurantiacum]